MITMIRLWRKRTERNSSSTWLFCDECGHRYHEGEKGYWGMYGVKLCCPICLSKHYKEEMERDDEL